MNRKILQDLSQLRVREARLLLESGYFAGAYYLLGYSVECALKACIARQVNRYDFPDKKTVNDSFTHNLDQLLGVAGLRDRLRDDSVNNPVLGVNWALVKDWSEGARYRLLVSEQTARDFYSACTSRSNGVLKWLRQSW
jgi:hypothetical protein